MVRKMALAPISIKVEERVKDRIDALVNDGRYRHVSDFMHRAIAAELERAEMGGEAYAREQLIRALRTDPDVRQVLYDVIQTIRDEPA